MFQSGAISPNCVELFVSHLFMAHFCYLVELGALCSTRSAAAVQFAFGGIFMLILSRTCSICTFFSHVNRLMEKFYT